MKKSFITELLFILTGSYHDMALRPYTARVTGEDLDRLNVATHGFHDFSAGALAGVAGSILRPSTADVGALSIDNGWNEQRYMFMMKVVHQEESYNDINPSGDRVQYITGYTDRVGDVSYSGLIDPSMQLYLCNVINTREIETSYGIRRLGISANRYIQQNGGQRDYTGHKQFYAMRPRDVCQAIGNSGLGDYVDTDFRHSLSTHALMSNIKNELPTDYLNRTFESFRLAVNSPDVYMNDMPSLMNTVASNTGDEGPIDDPFIMNLYRNTELCEGSSFTYGELCSMFPGTDTVARVPERVGRGLVPDLGFEAHQPNDTEHWFGTNNETIIASIAGSAIPALMVTMLLTQVSFYITNETIDGETYFEWLSPVNSFMMNGNLEEQAELFKMRMVKEIFRDMSRNNNITLSIRVFTDLVMSDTRIELSVEGGPTTPYCVPTFAAGLISPIIANSRDQLDGMATEVNNIFDEMGSRENRANVHKDIFMPLEPLEVETPRTNRRTYSEVPSTPSNEWKV